MRRAGATTRSRPSPPRWRVGPPSSPRAWQRPRASSCSSCRRCPWCAASARCWCSASCSRSAARCAPASRRSCASGVPRRRAAGSRRSARTRASTPPESGSRTAPGAHSGFSLSHPRRVLAIGLAVAVVGLALDTQSNVVSDVRELVPQDLQALKDVNTLQHETGVSGEIDVTVRADDITDAKVIAWMTRFQDQVPEGPRLPPGQALHAEAEPAGALSRPVAPRPVQHRRRRPGRGSPPARRGAGRTSRRAS